MPAKGAGLARRPVVPKAGRSGSSLYHEATGDQGASFPGQGKIIVTFALAESVFVSALINAQ